MSIAWIYATSNEIVSVVTMIGVVTGLSMELLGLTIMAWSNCIGDIVADVAVVKQGFPKMAMAAAIGGPLFSELGTSKTWNLKRGPRVRSLRPENSLKAWMTET